MARYVDVDKLIEEYDRVHIGAPGGARKLMVEAPTADVAEVKYGEWILDTECYDDDYSEFNIREVFTCSRCGRTESTKQPYCNCGAKMKGKDET